MHWKEELDQKSSTLICKEWKGGTREVDGIYDDTPASVIFFRARANCMELRDRKRHEGEDTKCIVCGGEIENLEHFLLHCRGCNELRTQTRKLQQPHIENRTEIIGNLLFKLDNKEELAAWTYQTQGRTD